MVCQPTAHGNAGGHGAGLLVGAGRDVPGGILLSLPFLTAGVPIAHRTMCEESKRKTGNPRSERDRAARFVQRPSSVYAERPLITSKEI